MEHETQESIQTWDIKTATPGRPISRAVRVLDEMVKLVHLACSETPDIPAIADSAAGVLIALCRLHTTRWKMVLGTEDDGWIFDMRSRSPSAESIRILVLDANKYLSWILALTGGGTTPFHNPEKWFVETFERARSVIFECGVMPQEAVDIKMAAMRAEARAAADRAVGIGDAIVNGAAGGAGRGFDVVTEQPVSVDA